MGEQYCGVRSVAWKIGAASLCLISSLIAQPAWTYQRSMTCRVAGSIDPLAPTTSPICRASQSPYFLTWPAGPIALELSLASDANLDPDALKASLNSAAQAWMAPSCAALEVSVSTSMIETIHDPQDQINRVGFSARDWPQTQSAYAVTSLTFDAQGVLSDVDIELNAERYAWSTTVEVPVDKVDVLNTLTHEVGHVLGLDHSPVEGSTMFFDAPLGESSKRTLEEDDIAGICEIYPAPRPVEQPDEGQGCCSQAAAVRPATRLGGVGWGMLAMLFFGWRRRRMRR